MSFLIGRILGKRYELIEKIGSGGMANVYKAKCQLLKRFVAIKILRPELVEDEEFVARFKRESQAAASLSHPNIVNVFDVGEETGVHYIVMEYVQGKTLKELIKEKSPMDFQDTIRISLQICAALKHAHNNKIVHRDIKPQNILVSDDGTIKVADFGIARAVTSSTVTIAGANVIGSVHYFSPEQARGSYVDTRSDIYSLGIVIYEMLTGKVPFEGDTAISVALKHIQENVLPINEINPNVPNSIQDIIEKAIEKDPNKRYQDIEEMINDLKHSLKEPYGNFVVKRIDSNMVTQVVPALHIDNENTNEKQKSKKNNWWKIALTVVPSILIIYIAFHLGNQIYKNNFVSDEVEVPYIIGLSEENANRALKERNLSMEIISKQYDKEVLEGLIIAQEPNPPMKVKTSTKIKVIISKGPKMIPIPNFVNKRKEDADLELQKLNLQVEYLYENNDYPNGIIFRQSISPKTEVSEDESITLWVSNGPEITPIEVRDYTGLLPSVAEELIIADKLTVGETGTVINREKPNGVIVNQSPKPGDFVEEGTPIDLWVNNIPSPFNLNELEIDLSSEKDKSEIQVIVKQIKGEETEIIYNSTHSVSEGKIIIPVEGTGKVDFEIYFDNKLKKKTQREF